MTIFTVGHSTLSEGEFVAMLRRNDVGVLMDVRSHSTSKWPQFWREQMQGYLRGAGIRYEWEPRLGGWQRRHSGWFARMAGYGIDLGPYMGTKFPKQAIAETLPDPGKPAWTNLGLLTYSFFTALPEFSAAGRELILAGRDQNVAIVCAEALWWRCHRSMIADWLVWAGADAVHVQPKPTSHSSVLGNRLLRYHPDVVSAWERGGMQI